MNVDVKPEKNKQIDIEITIDDFIINKHLKSSASRISNSTNIAVSVKFVDPFTGVLSISLGAFTSLSPPVKGTIWAQESKIIVLEIKNMVCFKFKEEV